MVASPVRLAKGSTASEGLSGSGSADGGPAGAFAASGASDVLINAVYALKAGHRQNGTFVMSRRTQGAVRKLKDADGNYLWAPPARAGDPASLMGFPVAESEDMPEIAANATDEGVRKHALEQIQTSVDRTARLVTGLLALAREDEAAIEADDRRWVDLRALLANDADARLEVLDQAFRIYVQPDRFETAVANLLAI